MKEGSWLIIKNAEQIDGSILERFNSLGEHEPIFHFTEFGSYDLIDGEEMYIKP